MRDPLHLVSRRRWWSLSSGEGCVGLAAVAVVLILGLFAGMIGIVAWQGGGGLSWRFLVSGAVDDVFETRAAGVLPMVLGMSMRVLLMSLFVMPGGVVTALYLTEYARSSARTTRIIRGAVSSLAGVPSIVFGLFGLGFFVQFVGSGMDSLLRPADPSPLWGREGLLWASLTLAVMTLPVVIVATEESLRGIPAGLREASLALGATRLQTLTRVVLPEALPGILTGAILAMSRAAGEVAPILFTGAIAVSVGPPHSLTDRFMDLGYYVFLLSTQGPDIERTQPILFAAVLVLLGITMALNLVAILIRARLGSLRRRRLY